MQQMHVGLNSLSAGALASCQILWVGCMSVGCLYIGMHRMRQCWYCQLQAQLEAGAAIAGVEGRAGGRAGVTTMVGCVVG
jgi:hypothetical protein